MLETIVNVRDESRKSSFFVLKFNKESILLLNTIYV